MNDLEAIRRLIAIYGQLLDSKRIAEWGQLFTDDARFRVWGRSYRGRAEIEREIGGMQPERPGKHVTLAPVIELDGEDRARVWSDVCVFSAGEDGITIATIGRYHDELRRDADGRRWRFEQRVLVMSDEPVPEDVSPTPAY